jgi:hypothetical protein
MDATYDAAHLNRTGEEKLKASAKALASKRAGGVQLAQSKLDKRNEGYIDRTRPSGAAYDAKMVKGKMVITPNKPYEPYGAATAKKKVTKLPMSQAAGALSAEAVTYTGLGTDVVDKKKKLNPQPNLMMKPKQVKDFKEEAEELDEYNKPTMSKSENPKTKANIVKATFTKHFGKPHSSERVDAKTRTKTDMGWQQDQNRQLKIRHNHPYSEKAHAAFKHDLQKQGINLKQVKVTRTRQHTAVEHPDVDWKWDKVRGGSVFDEYNISDERIKQETIAEGKMKEIYTDMMDHATKKGYSSHKQFTPADYDAVGKLHGISGKELAVIAGHKTAAQVTKEEAEEIYYANMDLFLEALMSPEVMGRVADHEKAGNKVSDHASRMKNGEMEYSFVVTQPSGKRSRHIYHGNKTKHETMSPAPKSKEAHETGEDDEDK